MNAKPIFTLLCCTALATAGCSARSNSFGDSGGGFPDATANDSGSTDGTTDDGGSGTTDAGRPRPDVQEQPDDGVINPDAACSTQMYGATREALNLLIVLDRSGSMGDPAGSSGSQTKWSIATTALAALLGRLDDSVRVGLTFFPADSNDSSIDGYTTPAVPVAPLAGNRTRLVSALMGTGPNGDTPMSCAMQGSGQYFTGAFTLDGSRNMVLITDGQPTDECSGITCDPSDIFNYANCEMQAEPQAELKIQAAVSRAARSTPPVRTFVIGTPDATDSFLSNLAVNGQTERTPDCRTSQTCHYSLNSGSFQTDLDMALADIQGRAASCQFAIDIDPTMVNPDLINVDWTPDSMSSPTVVPRDVSHTDGWDYSTDMRNVILYGPICDTVKTNTTGGNVQIIFGCPTIVPG